MLFRKRQKHPPLSDSPASPERPQFFRIDFDMMLKGSMCKRRKKTVRQFGVTVNGATRLVTSGDVVDRETYDALLAVGAIRPIIAESPDTAHNSARCLPESGTP